MTAPTILSAIRMGELVLIKRHAALGLLWKKFGAEIRSQRKARKISMKAFGKSMGFSSQMVLFLERGERNWPEGAPDKAISILKLKRPVQWPDGGKC